MGRRSLTYIVIVSDTVLFFRWQPGQLATLRPCPLGRADRRETASVKEQPIQKDQVMADEGNVERSPGRTGNTQQADHRRQERDHRHQEAARQGGGRYQYSKRHPHQAGRSYSGSLFEG